MSAQVDETAPGDSHFVTISTPKASVVETYETAAVSSSRPSSPSKAGSSLRKVPKLAIEWKIDELTAKIQKSRRVVETKVILKQVNGVASAGQLVVIMGPSGAGKSSMLDIIAGRNKAFSGHVKVNGQPWTPELNKRACYVMQDDVFYHTLTVQEHLQFQAQFRMGNSCTAAQRHDRVQYVIDELGLRKCKDTRIGNTQVRGISGGERKRLSFATEILTNPSLLFVDEPTSGLDSFMAESVVQIMQKLAREGRTILATIHQPSSELFSLFDQLYLLSNGRTVYYGPAADSVAYFASIGYPCPNYMNPTDYFMRQIIQLDAEATARVHTMVEKWQQTEASRMLAAPETATAAELAAFTETRLGLVGQFAVLCKRNVTRLVRDHMAFKARLFQSLFISVIVGLIYLNLTMSQSGIQSFGGVLFFITINQVFSSANSEFLAVPLELPIMSREYNGGLYGSSIWYFAKNVSELPFQAFFPMIFLIPLYFMIGFGPQNATVFFTFYVFLVLLNSTATGVGYMVSCMVRRADLAPVIGIVLILPLVLFGGLFINTDNTPDYFIWLEYISPLKYAYRGVMRAFWSTVLDIPCDPTRANCVHNGAAVLKNASLDKASMVLDVAALLGLNFGFRFIGMLFLARNVKKRD
ncbi:hypothetical protein DYB37_007719 [Aphanomyces astaci]|uniref:ABC transporter domain-containing protein n=2 Tax=Aphanomyces astaci TaxID=112090 RepID=A0A397A6S6_APHAT|nr:hypothetical protein DYB25_002537 [Aphanomyces astaci]RHY05250.1 hypothetical protein DYB36_006639 [Aphanomyces astaci]RHY40331.1 hypothetical protein DYB38_003083 [Aphanomyces astaci]RHY43885.1 hypothetical protein DYB34_008803 [Aphanomyces astaci]RHY52331.1 hypothetical protein DYB30_007386 [Aphanomyces astaci]